MQFRHLVFFQAHQNLAQIKLAQGQVRVLVHQLLQNPGRVGQAAVFHVQGAQKQAGLLVAGVQLQHLFISLGGLVHFLAVGINAAQQQPGVQELGIAAHRLLGFGHGLVQLILAGVQASQLHLQEPALGILLAGFAQEFGRSLDIAFAHEQFADGEIRQSIVTLGPVRRGRGW